MLSESGMGMRRADVRGDDVYATVVGNGSVSASVSANGNDVTVQRATCAVPTPRRTDRTAASARDVHCVRHSHPSVNVAARVACGVWWCAAVVLAQVT